jgi:uncharacterized protein YccT (UPF0319 family)
MIQQTLSQDQIRALGESIRSKMNRAEVVRNVPPKVTPQKDTESGEKPETSQPKNQGGGMIEKEDSDSLFQLKRWWKKAYKKDRRKFIQWTKGEAYENGYGY